MSNQPARYAPAAEAELRRRLDEAEEALRAERTRFHDEQQQLRKHQDEFLSVLVHDLRNVLMPIGNAVQIMQVGNANLADRQSALQIVAHQLRDLAGLVDVLADASRIRRGRTDLAKVPVSLADIIARAAAACQGLIDQRRHQLTVSLPAESIWVLGEPDRLIQIFACLLHNAAKFTKPAGGIKVAALIDEADIEIRIEDNGVGIAAEFLPHIFDLFAKADHGAEGPRAGLGVGLALVRGLVALHDGSVQASSDGVGHGSVFRIRLPRLMDAKSGTQSEQPIDALAKERSRRILIVSENVDFAQEWSLLLRVAGHVVQTAANPGAALEAIEAFQPEVLSLDLSAPASETVRIVERVRQEPAARRPCVIGLANREIAPMQSRAHAQGCDALLTAPVKIRDFLRIIAETQTRSS